MTYYIFLYCTIHDDGFIIKSENTEIPADYNYNITCKCEGSEFCDFIYNGMISYDGINIKEIDSILRNYEKFGGGFKFKYYKRYFEKESGISGWLDLNSH
jgi:hypothetical protein